MLIKAFFGLLWYVIVIKNIIILRIINIYIYEQ